MKKSQYLFILLAIILVASCTIPAEKDGSPISDLELKKWPTPQDHEVQVMILGTYHMSNPHLDENNVNADDVRLPRRQKDLEELTDQLKLFAPDLVACEVNYKSQKILDSLYTISPLDSIYTKYTNEAIQVGIRLADKLGLNRVYAIDYPMRLGNDSLSAIWSRYGADFPHKIDYPKINWEVVNKQSDSLLYESTIREYLALLNTEDKHMRNHYGMYADIRKGYKDNFGGPQNLAKWYDRNFRMAHNVYRAVTPETKKILVIVGAGHVSPLRHIFDEAPMFCPVSPLPYLVD